MTNCGGEFVHVDSSAVGDFVLCTPPCPQTAVALSRTMRTALSAFAKTRIVNTREQSAAKSVAMEPSKLTDIVTMKTMYVHEPY